MPDGLYEFAGDTLNVFSTWPVGRLRQLANAIQAAQAAPNPRAAVEQALTSDPDLADLLRKLSPLHDAGAFWGFIAVLLSTIMLLASQHDSGGTVINEHTVIERVVTQAAPATPRATTPPQDRARTKRPPPPPRRRKAKAKRGKRR